MVNYKLVNERNNGMRNIPRLSFLPPVPQQTGGQVNTVNNIKNCQSGCQLEFKFNNLKSCSLKNDGAFFSLSIPESDKNNYVEWNGSNVNGLELTKFYLKEVYFRTPARDKIMVDNIDKSIQIYYSFVNDRASNLMITVSIIGQVNNPGETLKTKGFKLLEVLANKIPPPNGAQVQLNNLSSVNLEYLLPKDKTFFSTLIGPNTVSNAADNIQYVIMNSIIDIPSQFFDSLVAKTLDNIDRYNTIKQDYNSNPPVNPQGLIIFYTEDIRPMGLDEGIVCDKNCNQAVGSASDINPGVGDIVYTESPIKKEETKKDKKKKDDKEKCENVEVEPGKATNLMVEKAEKDEGTILKTFIVLIVVIAMSISIFVILMLLKRKFGYPIFSKAFWTSGWWIVFGVFLIANVIYTLTWALIYWIPVIEATKDIKEDEISETEKKSKLFYLQPLIIWLIATFSGCFLIWAKTKKAFDIGLQDAAQVLQTALETGNIDKRFSVTNQLSNAIKYMGSKFPTNDNLKVLVGAVNKKFLTPEEYKRLFAVGTDVKKYLN